MEIDLGADNSDLAVVLARYPCLLHVTTQAGSELRGTFPVVHDAEELGAFNVRIELRRSGKHHVATVFEVGGRIPQVPARHVNPDGSACIALPEDIWLATAGEPMRLSAFLDGPVRDFFLGQVIFARNGRWPFGDRGHGADGLHEFYQELIGTRDLRVAARYVAVLAEPQLHRQWICPCGSRQKLRRCHRDQIATLRQCVPPRVAVLLRGRLGTLA